MLTEITRKCWLMFAANYNRPTSEVTFEPRNVRIYRQAGYVYNKPSISFDLPIRSTTTSPQAPNGGMIREQHMYYAYPMPIGRSEVKIEPSTSGANMGNTGTTPSTGNSGVSETVTGYGYSTQGTVNDANSDNFKGSINSGGAGYNYDSQNTVGSGIQIGAQTAANLGSSGYTSSVGIQTGILSIGSSTGTGLTSTVGVQNGPVNLYNAPGSTDYTFNSPTSTTFNPSVSSGSISSKAPEYLPPPAVSSSSSDSDVVTGLSPFNSASKIGPLSESYLPPTSSAINVRPSSPSASSSPGPSSSASTGYLPPNSITPLVSRPPTNVPVSQTPTTGYLPPRVSTTAAGPPQGTLSTPAPTYLPPVFKR